MALHCRDFSQKFPRFEHSHKKRKGSQEILAVLLIFHLNLKYLGWPQRAYIGTAKNIDFCEELRSKNDSKAVLVIFCCYDYSIKASDGVQKIENQKNYCKCSLCDIIYRIDIHMNNSEKDLVSRTPSTQLKKLLKLHRKKINKWTMVSFVHNGSEIKIWMQYSFNTKSVKSEATFSRFEPTYFWNFKLQIVRLAQGHWICMPTIFKIAAFTAAPMKKHIQLFILPRGVFL